MYKYAGNNDNKVQKGKKNPFMHILSQLYCSWLLWEINVKWRIVCFLIEGEKSKKYTQGLEWSLLSKGILINNWGASRGTMGKVGYTVSQAIGDFSVDICHFFKGWRDIFQKSIKICPALLTLGHAVSILALIFNIFQYSFPHQVFGGCFSLSFIVLRLQNNYIISSFPVL